MSKRDMNGHRHHRRWDDGPCDTCKPTFKILGPVPREPKDKRLTDEAYRDTKRMIREFKEAARRRSSGGN